MFSIILNSINSRCSRRSAGTGTSTSTRTRRGSCSAPSAGYGAPARSPLWRAAGELAELRCDPSGDDLASVDPEVHPVVLEQLPADGGMELPVAAEVPVQVDDADALAVRARDRADELVEMVDAPRVERGSELVGPVHDVPILEVGHGREHDLGPVAAENVDRALEITGQERIGLRCAERDPRSVDATVVHVPRTEDDERDVRVELVALGGPAQSPVGAVVADGLDAPEHPYVAAVDDAAAHLRLVHGDDVVAGCDLLEPEAEREPDRVADDEHAHRLIGRGGAALRCERAGRGLVGLAHVGERGAVRVAGGDDRLGVARHEQERGDECADPHGHEREAAPSLQRPVPYRELDQVEGRGREHERRGDAHEQERGPPDADPVLGEHDVDGPVPEVQP